MKKLMIALAVIATAVISQAAQLDWKTSGLQWKGSNIATGGATGYLWIVDDISSYATFTDGAELSKQIFADYSAGKLGKAVVEGQAIAGKGALTMTDGKSYSAGDTVSAIVMYLTTQDGGDYVMGNIGSYHFEAAQDDEVAQLAKVIGGNGLTGTANATAWAAQSVPEPTSGLLLLLGMAGLALRRRRA